MGHPQVTKIHNEGKLYSVRSLVVVQILNFQQDLVVMRFIRIELITCLTSKLDRVKVHTRVARDVLILQFCDLRMAHSGRNMSSSAS